MCNAARSVALSFPATSLRATTHILECSMAVRLISRFIIAPSATHFRILTRSFTHTHTHTLLSPHDHIVCIHPSLWWKTRHLQPWCDQSRVLSRTGICPSSSLRAPPDRIFVVGGTERAGCWVYSNPRMKSRMANSTQRCLLLLSHHRNNRHPYDITRVTPSIHMLCLSTFPCRHSILLMLRTSSFPPLFVLA